MAQVTLIVEAKKKTLGDISLSKVHQAQQAALMRLQLYFIGRTHEILSNFSAKAQRTILENAGENGRLDAVELYQTQQQVLDEWQSTYMDTWLPAFQAARREAASIPFGVMAIYHEKYLKPAAARIEEQEGSPVFEPQLQALIDAANQRIYPDGLQLSSRIWKLDRESRQGINQALMAGIQESKSAWQLAKDVEQYLGANQDCPRWTSTRLYALTKKDIASGDRRGLKTGIECQGQGVSYKALRMARTEIQAVHHIATDAIMAAQPWVEKEQVVLSPAHPVEDICDEAADAGPQPKGTFVLPLHPNCICWKEAILMDEDEFIGGLRGWLAGGTDAGLDTYTDFLGLPKDEILDTSFLDNAISQALLVWLWGQAGDLANRMNF
jgi:hypothetical protein